MANLYESNKIQLFSGSKTLDTSYVGISNWYRAWAGVSLAYLNPDHDNPTPPTYSLNRYATINQEYGGTSRWNWIEKLKGQYDYAQLTIEDNWVKYWKDLGKDIMTEIGHTPAWANINVTGSLGASSVGLGYSGGNALGSYAWTNSGTMYFNIGQQTAGELYSTSVSFPRRHTVYSLADSTKKLSGKCYRQSQGVTNLTIGAGTGAASGTWGTTGGTGTGATGTFTETGGVITSFTISTYGNNYGVGESVVALTGSLGTNTLTLVKNFILILTVDTASSGFDGSTISDWYVKVEGGNLAPTSMADFADWCEFIFARNERAFTTAGDVNCGWGGAVRYWFVRNEPSLEVSSVGTSQYFRDSAEKYAEMLRVASQIAKKHNPLNKIIGCDVPYPSNNEFLLEVNKNGASTDSTTLEVAPKSGVSMRSKLNGWYVLGSGIKRGTTVLSGEGTTTLILSKTATVAHNAAIYFRPPPERNCTLEILESSALGFDTASYGITGNTTGAGTFGKDWIDIVGVHGYQDDIWANADKYTNVVFEWLRFKKSMDDAGISKPIWQTEHQRLHIAAPYQWHDDLLLLKRSFIAATFAAGTSHWIWFGLGGGNSPTGLNNATGVLARSQWRAFFLWMFASPITSVEFDVVTKKFTVTRADAAILTV